jgi:hypothetical protein
LQPAFGSTSLGADVDGAQLGQQPFQRMCDLSGGSEVNKMLESPLENMKG